MSTCRHKLSVHGCRVRSAVDASERMTDSRTCSLRGSFGSCWLSFYWILDQQCVLAQVVVFPPTELLGLIRHLSADFCAEMINGTKVVIRGYGETVAKSPVARFLIFSGSGEAAC